MAEFSNSQAVLPDSGRRVSGGEVEALGARTREPASTSSAEPPRIEPWLAPSMATEHFEVRDPTAEVTYRVNSLEAAQGRAKALGTTQMLAIDGEGRRTPMRQIGGGNWERSDPLPPRRERPAQAWAQERDGESPTARPVPETDAGLAPRLEAAADRAALTARIESALAERYVVRRQVLSMAELGVGKTEYRFRGDSARVAFTASPFKLATQSDNPSVARSMVDLAQARGWKGVRISGSEDFRRLVWMEASVRGMRTQGYEPTPAELDQVRREQDARQTNRIEPERTMASRDAGQTSAPTSLNLDTPKVGSRGRPARDDQGGSAASSSAPTTAAPPAAQKASGRGSGGGRKAVLAAIEVVLVSRGVTQARRDAVLAAAEQQLAARARQGVDSPRIKVYDAAAPSQRPTPSKAAPSTQRQRERTQPALAPGR